MDNFVSRFRSLIRKKCFSDEILTERDYSRSRNLFIAESCLANGIAVMATGVIVSGYLKFLGANDAVNGIISGIPVLAGILLIFSPVVMQKMKREKWIVLLFALVHRLLFASMLAVPLIFTDPVVRLVVFVLLLAMGHILGAFIGPSAANWLIKLIPDSIRGRYLGLREGITLIFMASFALLMALVIDYMKGIGHEMLGYLICSSAIFIMTIGNFACLLNIDEPITGLEKTRIGLRQVLTIPLQNHGFRKIIGLSVLWSFGLQFGGPFFGVYYYSVLGLDYTYIILMSLVASVVRMIAAQVWGRVADRKGWAFVSGIAVLGLGIVHISYMFLNRETMYGIFPLLQIASGISWAGVSISMFNLQFEYAPVQDRTVYIAFNAAISSIAGFSAVLVASLIVSLLQDRIYSFLSLPMSAMQFLFLGSGLLIILSAGYIKRFIAKS
jgi:MFS family permease